MPAPHPAPPPCSPPRASTTTLLSSMAAAWRREEGACDGCDGAIQPARLDGKPPVGGPDLRISIVSRGSESGTRRAFEKTVLRYGEPAVSSDDCVTKDRPTSDSMVVRCERGNADSLLQEVNNIPGAIGYAERSAVAKFSDVHGVQRNGRDADIEAVKQNAYPFFEVEYFYTYGEPQGNTLISAFLKYLNSGTAKNILRRDGYTPCLDGQSNLMGACVARGEGRRTGRRAPRTAHDVLAPVAPS